MSDITAGLQQYCGHTGVAVVSRLLERRPATGVLVVDVGPQRHQLGHQLSVTVGCSHLMSDLATRGRD